MAIGVVEQLEIINIDQHAAQPAFVAFCPVEFKSAAFHHEPVIVEAGQAVRI
jgi:hypothetical protein